MNKKQNNTPCTKCGGSGVQEYIIHGPTDEGEIGEEPIRCTRCDGVGSEPKMIDWHKLGLCRGGGGNNFHCGCKYNG